MKKSDMIVHPKIHSVVSNMCPRAAHTVCMVKIIAFFQKKKNNK